jgi:hypothetical protein
MDSIIELIKHKSDLLSLAEAEAEKLRYQINVLKEMANADDFSLFLEAKKNSSFNVKSFDDKSQASHATKRVKLINRSPQDALIEPGIVKARRNKKGDVRTQILSLLSDGTERDIDAIKLHMDKVLANPLPRAPLRTALMFLKKDGDIESRKAGYFNIPK